MVGILKCKYPAAEVAYEIPGLPVQVWRCRRGRQLTAPALAGFDGGAEPGHPARRQGLMPAGRHLPVHAQEHQLEAGRGLADGGPAELHQ